MNKYNFIRKSALRPTAEQSAEYSEEVTFRIKDKGYFRDVTEMVLYTLL